MSYYLDCQKYKKRQYLFFKENIQIGGNRLQTAWVWFNLNDDVRKMINKLASNIINSVAIPGLEVKSANHLHISLITINAPIKEHDNLRIIVNDMISKFVYNQKNPITITSTDKIEFLPTDEPKFMTIKFKEVNNYLEHLKCKLRYAIVTHFNRKYKNIYAIKVPKNKKYNNHTVLTFDAIRYFDTNNNEIFNFRLDEYENIYHVSISNKFENLDKYQFMIPIKYNRYTFNNINDQMFEYKIKSIKETDKKQYFFIHNIKLKPTGKYDSGTHAICNKDNNKVIGFIQRTYGFTMSNIKIVCGGQDKNLLQLKIFEDSKTINIGKDTETIVQSKLNNYSQEWIYFKLVRNN